MRLNYTITFDDFKAAQELDIRQRLFNRLTAFFVYRAVPVLAVVFFAGAVFFLVKGQSEYFAQCISFGTTLLFLSIVMPLARYIGYRKTYKRLFPTSQPDQPIIIDIDDERILSIVPGVNEGKIFWSGILRFAQNEKITLIYIAERRFFLFPTGAMSLAQRAELEAMIERHKVRTYKC